MAFWKIMVKSPPHTRIASMSVVKTFFATYDVELGVKFWRDLRKRAKGSKSITRDIVPTNYELKKILLHADLKGRALFMSAATSGMRIDEILHLELSDIDFKNNPVKITIRGEIAKNGDQRIAFISDEAKEAVNEWVNVRDNYLRGACGKTNFKGDKNKKRMKSLDDPRLFPFGYSTARIMLDRICEKAGFTEKDKTTGRKRLHIHCLRKFFRTKLGAEISTDIVEQLMGHEGYLTREYRDADDRTLAKLYQKGMYALAIFEKEPDMSRFDDQLKEKDFEIKKLNQEMKDIKAQMSRLMVEKLINLDRGNKV